MILVALYFFVFFWDTVILLLSTFFSGSFFWSGSQIFHIGTVLFYDINLACLILWYIPIFHLVAHANIHGADCSSISFNGFTKYLDSCCGITNDQREYKSVTCGFDSILCRSYVASASALYWVVLPLIVLWYLSQDHHLDDCVSIPTWVSPSSFPLIHVSPVVSPTRVHCTFEMSSGICVHCI